jgi:hypothetical protein
MKKQENKKERRKKKHFVDLLNFVRERERKWMFPQTDLALI